MKRRVRRLEVTTFPFLAVLLCTMGSLILLLFVFDRRAKVVALHKANEDAAARAALLDLEYKGMDEKKSDWERRRHELHAALLKEQAFVEGKIKQANSNSADAQFKLQAEEKRASQLETELSLAEKQLAVLRLAVQGQQNAAAGTSEQANSGRRELERKQLEYLRLEKALTDLKALRQRQQNSYSIVPYFGARGDRRKPIYLEISSDGVLFHPDRVTLTGLSLTAANLRAEVEKRIQQTSDKPVDPAKAMSQPYLLMLVRPNGIANYYKAQEALAGVQVDFGYELIEQDWALDFSSAAKVDVAQTDREAPKSVQARQIVNPPPPSTPVTADGHGLPPLKAGSAGVGMPQSVPAPPVAGSSWLPSTPPSMPTTRPGGIIGAPSIASAPAQGTDAKDGGSSGKEPSAAKGSGKANDASKSGSGTVGIQMQPPASLGRILGNRDLVIDIDCRGDGVLLKHGNQKFPRDVLSAPTKGEHSLAKAIREIIARRQATLGPGEPPYRPMIRFLVRPEGLAAYYLAYPLLERLQTPMQRENVDKDS